VIGWVIIDDNKVVMRITSYTFHYIWISYEGLW